MMALMVLGMPQVYSCHTTTGCGAPLGMGISEPRVCPPIGSGREIGISGRVGHEAVEKTACDTLHGHAVISILHVRTGRP
jgi:hypothetical protein